MTVQKKVVAAPALDSLDEIDKIMNEIEELQQGMASPNPAPAKARVAAVETPAEAVEEEESSTGEGPSSIAEFQAGSGEVSMEETLSNLKDDEPSGPNLIDQTIQAESEAEASASDTDSDEESELLDQDEATALEEAIEAEEAEAEEFEEETEVIENTAPPKARPRPVIPMRQKNVSGEASGSVAVTLSGNMTLKLSYEFEGQEVSISFDDGALQVELSDGTEFKIPVRRNHLRKVA